jgi:hypothetical protein
MTDTPTVDFRCTDDNEARVTSPKPAREEFPTIRESQWMSETLAANSHTDLQTHDAVTHGWYIYPPAPVSIASNDDGELDVQTGHEFVSVLDENDSTRGFRITVDTLWHVNIPDGYVLLVTSPLYASDHPTRPVLLTSGDDWPSLTIPMTLTGTRTFHDIEPIAQAMVLSEDLLTTSDYATGEFDADGEKRLRQARKLRAVYDNPYQERIRTEKPDTDVHYLDSHR